MISATDLIFSLQVCMEINFVILLYNMRILFNFIHSKPFVSFCNVNYSGESLICNILFQLILL